MTQVNCAYLHSVQGPGCPYCTPARPAPSRKIPRVIRLNITRDRENKDAKRNGRGSR